MSYVYLCSEPETPLFTVGFYRPDGVWVPESDHRTAEGAAIRVAFLNGGNSPPALDQDELPLVHLDDPWKGSGL